VDNDLYAHINVVVYYSFFGTVINAYLIRAGRLDVHAGPVIGLAVETNHVPLPPPVGLYRSRRCAGKLGRSGVRYEIGRFRSGHDETAATAHFVHVFVDRATRRPQSIPELIGGALARLLPPQSHTNR
jgi:acyl-CoA thioester hydrolase